MKKLLPLLVLVAACGKTTAKPTLSSRADPACAALDTAKIVEVFETITQDTTWTKDKVYRLEDHIFIEGATLTIEPGTRVEGQTVGSSLVVTSSARLIASGTKDEPIVFTSCRAEGEREPGDWGGVVLLGKAPINVTGGTEKIEGFPAAEGRTSYGGTDATHDCGTLRYVRVEFAGFELAKDNELNGITVGGCGNKTTIDFVQSHMGQDDAIEFFGGTVNAKHLVLTQADDDGLDWDYGWTGMVQFMIVQQNGVVGDNGIEADNNGKALDALPRSHPIIYNATLSGSAKAPKTAGKTQTGALLRRGTAGEIYNTIFLSFTDFPVDIRDAATVAQMNAGALTIESSCFFNNGFQGAWDDVVVKPEDDDDGGFNEGAFFTDVTRHNLVSDDPLLTAPTNLVQPGFKPQSSSSVLLPTNARTPDASSGFFDASAKYIGAIGTVDWTESWTAYPVN
ncbi:MAG: hypothetical protein IT381_15065 [Deltaproteobacteria bacterium]|nr:hypothetical protein [Deltaproteobacteria bacterium]